MRPSGNWPNTRGYKEWFFNFSVNRSIRFHGVVFFGRKNESNVYHRKRGHLRSSLFALLWLGPAANERCCIVNDVQITPGTQYKVTAVSIGLSSMYAANGRRKVTCDHVTSTVKFAFTDTGLRGTDQYDVSLTGHIPTIYFSVP